MIKARTMVAAAGIAVIAAGAAVAGTAPATWASTLSCTAKASCGGATLLYNGKGSLDLAVLAPDPNVNGGFGYWNEHVGFTTTSLSDSGQDFTVAQVSGEPVGKGGAYGLGEYAVIYTPTGHIPDDAAFGGHGTQVAYCLSVQDTYPVVRGHVAQRWALVLRPCDTMIGGFQQLHAPKFCAPASVTVTNPAVTCSPNGPDEWTVSNPDPYQVWAPVQVTGPALEFQNIGLNSQHYRHGYGGQNFVVDDRGFGGTGTWGIAYPENDGLNQKFTINGCSDPIKTFNSVYWNCPS